MQNLTDKSTSKSNFKNYFFEFLGTFVLTFTCSWAAISRDFEKGFQTVPALTAGLVTFVFMWMGAQEKSITLNPALTLTLLMMKRQSWADGIGVLILQFTGAVVAAGFVFIELSVEQSSLIAEKSVLGIPVPGSTVYSLPVMMGEMIAGVFLGFAYMSVYVQNKDFDPCKSAATIGTMVFLLLLTLTEPFGIGLNPARSLAPAIMVGKIEQAQLGHLLGPIIGCLLGAVVQTSVFSDDDDEDEMLEGDQNEKKQIIGHGEPAGEVEMQEQSNGANGK